MLDAFAVNGTSFLDIVHKMWEQFGHRVESQAVQRDGYGQATTMAKDLDVFLEACIRPQQTDRSGATAEISLRKVVRNLKNIGVLASKLRR
ncbi:hypothetical protein PHMEG_00013999 [Phytophthora megakarya]|uniref:Uncharacterized protein n=1 Tax=Phytophthora megakarya TaxID=4795 RepID=A0A225W5Z4_9STRA|nr:hypothetical protein PHMEG_00013999 [Phytophthora megakarya]